MERINTRKVYTGKVVSTKMEKTITVVIDTYKKHSLYSKRVKETKKFHVHDEDGVAKIGDVVTIIETRPYSKTKRFRLLEVVTHAEVA